VNSEDAYRVPITGLSQVPSGGLTDDETQDDDEQLEEAPGMAKEAQRADLHKTIWQIANDLRGSVDGWDFKQYVLGMLFYRFISENLAAYLNEHERKAGSPDFDYGCSTTQKPSSAAPNHPVGAVSAVGRGESGSGDETGLGLDGEMGLVAVAVFAAALVHVPGLGVD